MFDAEETTILEAFEKDQLQRRANAEEEIVLARQAAREYLSPSESITIQLSPHDVSALEARAEESGIPYPTLISTLVHQYITGKIQIER